MSFCLLAGEESVISTIVESWSCGEEEKAMKKEDEERREKRKNGLLRRRANPGRETEQEGRGRKKEWRG